MASILKVDTITGVTTAGSISVTGEGNSTTTNLQQGLTKQWCALNGTGTIAILDSFNVSSVTDVTTGTYGFVCTSNFSSANHTPSGEVVAVGNFSSIDLTGAPATTGTGGFRCFNIGAAGIDSAFVSYQSCGDLA
jgi:hypothetical protein